MKIELSHQAREELRGIDERYCGLSIQTGETFLKQYLDTLDVIKSFPDSGINFRKRYKIFPIGKFPYLIVCRLFRSHIMIVHILHNRRHQKQRVRGIQ